MVGTFSYDPSTNVITVTGGSEASPVTFNDFYNADKAGTFGLYDSDRSITAVDGSAVAVDNALRPTDYVVLGGATGGDLYIEVANWTNMTTADIEIVGTDRDGDAQSETLTVTGDGTYNATKWYKTITSTQVTVFTKSDTGSFDYNLVQGQWGVIWREPDALSYRFDALTKVGDTTTTTWVIETSKNLYVPETIWTANNLYIFTVYEEATLRFGTLNDATKKTTAHGLNVLVDMEEYIAGSTPAYLLGCGLINVEDKGVAQVYASKIVCLRLAKWPLRLLQEGEGDLTVYNTVFKSVDLYPVGSGGTVDIFDVTFLKNSTINPYMSGGTLLLVKIRSYDTHRPLIFWYARIGEITDFYRRGATTHDLIRTQSITTDRILINVDSDTWLISWGGGAANTAKIFRKYTIDLRVTDEDGVAIEGASVKLEDKDDNEIFDVTTDSNGDIATQTVTYAYYEQPTGSTANLYSPFTMTISKADTSYLTQVHILVLDEKIKEQVSLTDVSDIVDDIADLDTKIDKLLVLEDDKEVLLT